MNGQNRRKLTTAGLAISLLSAGVGGYFWQSQATAQTNNTPPAVAETPAIKDAATMQSAFAQVARTVEPAVVTITTTVKRPQMVRQFRGNPFGDENPFGDDDLQEFFRRFGPGRMRPNSASPDEQIGQGNFRPIQDVAGGLGSGFIFDKSGLVMTNAHVVRGASTVNVKLQDGREFKNAKVLGTDNRSDIAVIKIDGANLPSVTLGDSGKVEVGDWAIAVGNPFGLSNTLTVGVISAKSREVPMDARTPGDYLQTDASINPGNSGGPLLDIYGRVVGVNNSIWSPTGSNVGVGFAIPINTAKEVANQLAKNGKVRRAQMGVGITEIDANNAAAFGLPASTQGALVTMVEPGGAAAKAGLLTGDVITRFNGEAVTRPAEIQRKVSAAPIGQDATLDVIRNGATKTLKVRLDEATDGAANPRLSPRQPDAAPDGESIDEGREGIGVRIAPLTPDLAEQLNVKPDTKGIVVMGVEPDSPAANAGLQPGDLITRVGQTAVTTPDEVRTAVKRILDGQSGSDKKVALYITRRGVGQYVVVGQ